MKVALAILAATLAFAGLARARESRLPENYHEWLEWSPPKDRRPFLTRLFSKPSVWGEVGAKKRKESDSLIPEKLGLGISFGTDL